MKKLIYLSYQAVGKMSDNKVLGIIDNLKVGEGIKVAEFPDYHQMREFTSRIEPHLSQICVLRRVADEKNLTYIVRRTE